MSIDSMAALRFATKAQKKIDPRAVLYYRRRRILLTSPAADVY
jgi:hypothetical protein